MPEDPARLDGEVQMTRSHVTALIQRYPGATLEQLREHLRPVLNEYHERRKKFCDRFLSKTPEQWTEHLLSDLSSYLPTPGNLK